MCGKKVADLHSEIRSLEEKWDKIYKELKASREPKKLLSEINKTASILRDVMNDNFNRVVVDNKEIFKGLKEYIAGIAPDKKRISRHTKTNVQTNQAILVSFLSNEDLVKVSNKRLERFGV